MNLNYVSFTNILNLEFSIPHLLIKLLIIALKLTKFALVGNKSSNMMISFLTDKQQVIDIGAFNELNCQEYLQTLDQRHLKRINYSVKQIIGSIYKRINQIRSEMHESIN